MPIYEYLCPACEHREDVFQKHGDPPPPCPDCENPELRKIPSVCGFHLVGGGWAAQGYDKNQPVYKGSGIFGPGGRMINAKSTKAKK